MNSFALARLNMALFRIDSVIATLALEPTCSSERASLLQVKGELAAMRQLLEMEADLAAADTERPAPVKLTVVR